MNTFSLIELAQNIQDKKISCQEACSFYLDKIEKLNPRINAVITVNEHALDTAKKRDQKGLKGLPLEGVPVLIKDMFCTKGLKTTAGSKILENFIPPYSATAVERLEQAGAVILGKCNQDEFAMGNSNENSYFKPCKNPWNLDHTPGGSSGGSAAGVSAGMAPLALGTDTGGSIRQPSHFCGVLGVKPTYGRVSRYGIIAYASSLDQAGPITRQVKDSALVLHLISGPDGKDSALSPQPAPHWHKKLNAKMQHLKIGWLGDSFSKSLAPPVQESLELTRKTLEKNNNFIQSVSFSLSQHSTSVYYLISSSEAGSNLARYDGIRFGKSTQQPFRSLEDFYSQTRGEGFGREVKRRILMGTFCLSQGYYSAYFEKAQKVRRLICSQLEDIFKEVDVIISPTTANLPPKLGCKQQGSIEYYTSDALTVFSNLAGLPSLSVPVGIFENFPLGVQIIGKNFEEQKILDTAYFLEKSLQAYKQKPSVS